MEETEGPAEFYDTETALLLENAVRYWDLFYKRNTDHFFKDRAWLAKELPEIAAACTAAEKSGAEEHPLLVDVGCGVGNALIPILTANPRLHGVAFDCSPRAVSILQERWAAICAGQQDQRLSECSNGGSCSSGGGERVTQLPQIESLNKESTQREAAASRSSACTGSAVAPVAFLGAEPAASIAASSATPGIESPAACVLAVGGANAAATPAAASGKPPAAAAVEAVSRGAALLFKHPCGQLRTVAAFDITAGEVPPQIAARNSAEFVLLIFVLSAMHPKHHRDVARRCAQLLKPGGMVLFRDYARLDMAQLRFAEQKKPKVASNLYARYDGTLAYYFSKEEVEELFSKEAGLEVCENRWDYGNSAVNGWDRG
ncbi:hypothetical protein, conserved [Eimeria necatrix]|uniref:Methyltransferase-like protein n=1 Tax=Eimeria necatrix TaxID=51315 RepID=U6MI99_9EIME|nr:hypothetical protein, conserved [Eimeria necatrix]CDJ63746.1 hypothetical protein, conserved [Eimeria necatrix]